MASVSFSAGTVIPVDWCNDVNLITYITVPNLVNGPGSIGATAKITGATGAIVASSNIATVVRNSAGNYSFTFTSNMPNANYQVVWTTNTLKSICHISAIATTGFTIIASDSATGTAGDPTSLNVSVIRV
jgi:hypothetical protein